MKIFSLAVAALFFLSMPVLAQGETATVDLAISAKRIELAQKMHEIWPIRTRMESAIDSIAQGFPEAKQPQIKAAMRKSMKYDQLEEGSVKAMAETFTEEELEEMIKFYGSETGRSISAKTGMYEDALRPIMMEMIDKAMLDVRTGQKP
jgi:hypothetical protein